MNARICKLMTIFVLVLLLFTTTESSASAQGPYPWWWQPYSAPVQPPVWPTPIQMVQPTSVLLPVLPTPESGFDATADPSSDIAIAPNAATVTDGWNGSAYVGLKAPFLGGDSHQIVGDRTSHQKNSPPSDIRHAIDIGVIKPVYNFTVLAMHKGTVLRYVPNNGGAGNSLYIDHGDGYCSAYLHLASALKTSGQVAQGEEIAISGNTGNGVYHLHVEIDKIVERYGTKHCNVDNPKTEEVPFYFDEIPGREVKTWDNLRSKNFREPVGYSFCAFEGGTCAIGVGWKDVAFGNKGV